MKIFDCHCHIEKGLRDYNIDSISKNIIFNSFEHYEKLKDQIGEKDVISLIFAYKDRFAEINKLVKEKKISALKIHSRIQEIHKNDYPYLCERLEELNPNIPIIIDAFYFGDELDFQPSLSSIIQIAKRFPNVPVIVAHCGGIHVLRYFYHLKNIANVFFDLSLSLAYLKATSVFLDFKNLIRYASIEKLIFGTDYPWIDAKKQKLSFDEIADELSISNKDREKILYSNSLRLFKSN